MPQLLSDLSTKYIELYGIARLHKDLATLITYPLTEIYCIGVYQLCVIFIVVRMEHVTPINQSLALLISFLQWL